MRERFDEEGAGKKENQRTVKKRDTKGKNKSREGPS